MEYVPLSKIFYLDRENFDRIYNERFNNPSAIKFDFLINGNKAFFLQEPIFISKIRKIYQINSKISVLCCQLPGQALEQFAKKCLIDEIILSNNVEGVHSSRKELKSILEQTDNKKQNRRFEGLVRKYLLLSSNIDADFVDSEDIRVLYDQLVYNEIKEDDPDALPDGKIFRKASASVMSETQREIHRGVNPESEIINCMNKALDILNDDNIECIFRIAVFHYLFGYIHPFYDGNGRTSRFISSYMLAREFGQLIGYRISYSIKENIKDYYKAFKTCNDPHNKGDLTPFVIMFTDIIIESMENLYDALLKKNNLLCYYGENISLLKNGLNEKYINLYFHLIQASLFADDGISVQELVQSLNISRSTLNSRLKEIEDCNLLIKKKFEAKSFYSINLETFDKIISEKSSIK